MKGDSIREEIRSAIQDLITDGKQSFSGIDLVNQIAVNLKGKTETKLGATIERAPKLTEDEYDQLLEDFDYLIRKGYIMHDIGKSTLSSSAFRLTKEGRGNVF